ncbi:TPA: DUF1297 domain-containing protein [archaeon]|uniref:DUF1297 domain-containing protein n=1 Tax=Candidatus Naiadarchaeum limnaeum TaxID=2756139 RepID=A0A832XLP4_9ARCH|nr:DUF1297 domain-containing protein [Candidatus Naiadarchaeales archaeon SRR2090153.bin1042]HIK00143.1 DUF1297 domain-containing protein [Candidatus Naiadarchaeum limnaeum]
MGEQAYDFNKILEKYNFEDIHIGVLGGHSALDVARGAKKFGFKTVAVCQRGREKTYDKYFKTRGNKGIIDKTIVLDKFSHLTKPDVVKKLQSLNTIFIHNRYFWVYFDFKDIEKNFPVPIFGNRFLLRAEERDQKPNQYDFLEKAKIPFPQIFKNPKHISKLSIVKVAEAERGYERAFFFASNYGEYEKKSQELIDKLVITEEDLKRAVIEEYIVGAQVNFNYFYSALNDELELMGTDTRRQTNIDGLVRLPAHEQHEVLQYLNPKYIETGHIAVTVKESLLEQAFELGEKFVKTLQTEAPPGIVGPFALQGAVTAGPPKEEFVCFDVSFRIPGSPGTIFTPYSSYLHGNSLSYGERIAMEIKEAMKQDRLSEVVT